MHPHEEYTDDDWTPDEGEMTSQPYNLNQPEYRLWREVARRIEQQLQNNDVMVSFDSLPAVEDLIAQYNTELTNAWDKSSREYITHEKERIAAQERIASMEALLRWGVRMLRKPGAESERQKWIEDASRILGGKIE